MIRPGRLTCSDAALVRRARYGETRAARRLAERHLERVSVLATVVGSTPEESAQLARQGFALALQEKTPFESALVQAFGTLAARRPDRDQALARLLVLLVDLEDEPVTAAAALLGLTPEEAHELRTRSGAASGALAAGRSCRGWGLAGGRTDLTAAERAAGADHLALCRRCRDHRALLDRERQALLARAAGVAGVLGAGQATALVLLPGLGGVLIGKAAIGVIAALGAAALATGSLVAAGAVPVARPAGHTSPAPAPALVRCDPVCVGPATASAPPAPVTAGSPRGSLPVVPVPGVEVPGVQVPVVVPPLPVPLATTLPSSLPVPLPTSLPLPLPSVPPLPLPTSLPTLPPLP